ncbi:MAG: TonB-dependent receptor domain-containing protein, partial [Longimicrobiales bacterium]
TDLRIALSETAIELDEVVVTGTAGAVERRSIGNAVSTIDAAAELELSGAPDVGTLINGRAAGVVITPGTGRIGSGPSINIRGRSTLSLNDQPLIYVDGVRVNNDIGTGPSIQGGGIVSRLNDFAPEDIESVEIIKGPAAATLYGTEASNGVIQIITKKGVQGEPRIGLTMRQGGVWFRDPEGRIPTNYGLDPTTGEVITWNGVEQENERGTPIWDTGHLQGYQVTLAGGSDAIQYYLSSTYDRDEGIEPDNLLSRYAGHANLSITPSDKFDVSTSLNVVKSAANLGADYGGSVMFSLMYGTPLLAETPWRGFLLYPPEVQHEVFENTQDIARFTGSVQLNHRPLDWFSHRLTVGLDQTSEDNQALSNFVPTEFQLFFSPVDARGSILQGLRNLTYNTVDYSGTVELALAPSLISNTSVGGQYYRRRTDVTEVLGLEFPAPGLKTAAAAADVRGSQDYVTNSTAGVFVQQQFGWNNRLFLTGAVRVDNNSAFGEDFDFVTYPKLSGTWVVSEEPFWRSGFVDQLKLRAAFGASGLQPANFAALRSYEPTTGPNNQPTITPQFVGNPDLKPERGEELEVGFEAGLFERVGIDFTYYTKRTRDAILERGVAPSGGFVGQQFVNIGEVSNRGVELQVDAQALARPNLGLDVSLSVATAEDEIEDLGGIPFITLGLPHQRHVEGYPIAGMWAKRVVSADLDAAGTAVNLMCDGGPENDGNPLPCAEAPRVFLGTITPKVSGAVSTTLTLWNRLRLYGLVDYKTGHKTLDTDNLVRCAIFLFCEANVRPENFDPTYIANVQNAGGFTIMDQFIRDASFARLREVSASYTLPDGWTDRIGADRASITLTGRNLHTWTDYPGLDPESRSVTGSQIAFDQARIPTLAQFITTINLTF